MHISLHVCLAAPIFWMHLSAGSVLSWTYTHDMQISIIAIATIFIFLLISDGGTLVLVYRQDVFIHAQGALSYFGAHTVGSFHTTALTGRFHSHAVCQGRSNANPVLD